MRKYNDMPTRQHLSSNSSLLPMFSLLLFYPNVVTKHRSQKTVSSSKAKESGFSISGWAQSICGLVAYEKQLCSSYWEWSLNHPNQNLSAYSAFTEKWWHTAILGKPARKSNCIYLLDRVSTKKGAHLRPRFPFSANFLRLNLVHVKKPNVVCSAITSQELHNRSETSYIRVRGHLSQHPLCQLEDAASKM